MMLKKKIRVAVVAAVALGLVGGAASMASATPQANLSDAGAYLYQAGVLKDASTSFGWTASVYASTSGTDINGLFNCPTDSTGVSTFMTDPGTERTPSAWKAFAVNAFSPGTTDVLTPNLKPSSLINGVPGQGSLKATGGTFSLGLACTTNNGLIVGAAFYRTVTVTAGTGAYVAAAVDTVIVAPPVGTTGDITLAPSVVAATPGVLSLTVPAGAAATFSAPSLVNNKSTTVGTLGAVTVKDERFTTRQGWDVTANVVDFKNAANATDIISKSQLGFAPSLTSTTATGVTVAAAQTAGSATYPAAFASGAAANTTGVSVLNAGLTFVAPQDKGVATYLSTMTVTVVSK